MNVTEKKLQIFMILLYQSLCLSLIFREQSPLARKGKYALSDPLATEYCEKIDHGIANFSSKIFLQPLKKYLS